MGGAPNYGKGRAFMQRMVDAERRNREQNIMVKEGKGRYPKCLPDKPYAFCPKETPEDPKNVPQDCKFCPHFIYSKFYSEVYMTNDRRLERLKKRGLPLVLGSK